MLYASCVRRLGPEILALVALLGGCGAAAQPSASQPSVPPATRVAIDRPVVVVVRAEWCVSCRHAAPAVAWLREQYGDRATFVDLDVTDDATSAQSAEKASRLGLGPFFADNRGLTGVTILG